MTDTETDKRMVSELRLGLILIRGTKCERVTTPGFGHCFRDGRVASALYSDDQACDSCIANAALEGKLAYREGITK